MAAATITLNNGRKIPALGLGTAGNTTVDNIAYAISIGYRHFDTAFVYKTEPQVGEGIRRAISAGAVKREDIFVCTKLGKSSFGRENVVPACRESLKNLGLDYIDLYLIHWPTVFVNKTGADIDLYKSQFVDTWRGMEDCVELGLVKSIGVSNFVEEDITQILNAAKIKPVMNQIEANPIHNQKKLIAFCKKHQIAVTAYSPLTSPNKSDKPRSQAYDTIDFEDPKLTTIGKKYGKTTSQVILRYLVDIGAIPIPKSTNQERLKQNLNIFDFKLTPQEIEVIDGFNKF